MNNMTPEQFCYWLNGYAELSNSPPNIEQWQSIKEHLATVFTKVTPLVFHVPKATEEFNTKKPEFIC